MGKILYQLFVNGVPKAQPRPRMTAKGHVYNPSSADAWKEEVRAAFLPCLKPTITGPVRLTVRFSLPMPKGMAITGIVAPHVKKPDTDNLLKAVMDSLTAVRVWKDDAQVFETLAGKYYTGKKTGAQITVETF
ncbi:MAG: RusA family crossover junction endodeoxyribonuclease [Treponema sp.]|jgi:Holliday junction resolvase RusA-like endonuclease|nr:RusA family crossover junction endodeoxyribonuclease [Treponema sp.]